MTKSPAYSYILALLASRVISLNFIIIFIFFYVFLVILCSVCLVPC